MKQQIFTVIGSTGNIGLELVRLLSESGTSARAILRNFKRATPLKGIAWMQADMGDKTLMETALAGTDRLFLLTGNAPGFGQTQIDIIQTTEKLGVQHVVKLSALGASPRTKSPLAHEHYIAEQALEESGMTWTILRPHAFMQNWLGEVAETVRAEGAFYAAIGDGKVPYIDARDIAAVAFEALLNPEKHNGQKYVLTSGEAVSYYQLADALSKATGKPVEYKALEMDEMRSRMEKQGIGPKMIESFLALAAYQKAGGPTERVSDSVREILGREPLTIEDFANYYKDSFK